MAVVLLSEVFYPFAHHFDVAAQFIAQAQHHERGVIAQLPQHHVAFAFQEGVQGCVLSVDGAPQGQFYLEINAFDVGGSQGCGRGRVGMAAVMVHAVLFGDLEHPPPRSDVHRGIAGQREHAGIVLAAQKSLLPVQHKLSPFCRELPHTKISLTTVFPTALAQADVQTVECRVELAPQQGSVAHVDGQVDVVAPFLQQNFPGEGGQFVRHRRVPRVSADAYPCLAFLSANDGQP